MSHQVGFMQGRLSPIIDGAIQSFPWNVWKEEVPVAKSIGLDVMEWTLDQKMLYKNPLMTSSGQNEIKKICKEYKFTIPSLTGDCFMQAPFWKHNNDTRSQLKSDFSAVVDACGKVGISFIVVPLVDNGSIENMEQEDTLIGFLKDQESKLDYFDIKILFESDFHPKELKRFMSRLSPDYFGINYDIGNSASLGFDLNEEFSAYGNQIKNIHVKDRVLAGNTVPLGDGNADFDRVFSLLHSYGYQGNYILQTARADISTQHKRVLKGYKRMVDCWLKKNEP